MNIKTILTCLFVLVFSTGDRACFAAPPDGATRDTAIVAWAQEHAVQIPSLDAEQVDPALGRAIDRLIKGKRVVFLGEPDHFIHEKYDYRLMLIRHLRTRGFTRIGMEMGLADGKRVDQYLTSGDESHLSRVAILGYDGDIRTDRDDAIPGFGDDSNPEFREIVSSETVWFYRQLRSLNARRPSGTRPLRWFGFDVSMKLGGGYVDAAAILKPHAGHPAVVKLFDLLKRVPSETRQAEIERLDRCAQFVMANRKNLIAAIGDDAVFELSQSIDNLAESLRAIDAIRLPPGNAERMEGLSRRERVMCRRLDELLSRLPKDEKIILLGHNLHLSKDSPTIKLGDTPMWPSLGTHLAKKLPGEVLAIWLLYDHGTHGSIRDTPPARPIAATQEMLEQTLARVGRTYLLPLPTRVSAADWLNEEHTLLMGGTVCRANLVQQADAVFFITEVSEPRKRK